MKSIAFLVLFLAVAAKADQLDISWIPCTNNEMCEDLIGSSQTSNCINGLCMCLNTTARMYDQCHRKNSALSSSRQRVVSWLTRNCNDDTDCEHIQHAKCVKDPANESRKICDCDESTTASLTKKYCLPIAYEPKAPCNETVQCSKGMGNGADCFRMHCSCKDKHHYVTSKKQCVGDRVHGESCKREDESCFQLADSEGKNALGCSKENVCRCIKRYSYIGGSCIYSSAPRAAVPIATLILMLLVFMMSS